MPQASVIAPHMDLPGNASVNFPAFAMHSHRLLLDLLDTLYKAPGSPTGWMHFVSQVRLAFGASIVHFISHGIQHRASGRTNTTSLGATTLEPALQQVYLEDWAAVDPWLNSPVTPTLTTGVIASGEHLVPQQQYQRSMFYNEFGRHLDVARLLFNITEREPHVLSALSIVGAPGVAPFDADDARLLSALSPHVQRAIQVHRRVAAAETCADDFLAALDRLPHGVILLDAKLRVVAANRLAAQLFRERDGLSVDDRELRADRSEDTYRLRFLAAGCARTSTESGLHAGGVLCLPRASGRTPLRVIVAPRLRWTDPATPDAYAVIVFVTDPDRQLTVAETDLRALFDLTPAEARLVAALAEGETVTDLATRLAVQPGTIRKQLRVVFEKTRTRRQADLVRLVLQSVAFPPK
jgi:DNA-binding CsgD family transcriptional regulator